MNHRERFYRRYETAEGCVFNVKIDSSDLFIRTDTVLYEQAFESLKKARMAIEEYIKEHDYFLHSLDPLAPRGGEHEIIMSMYSASAAAGVGPMAAVAGAIAETVGKELLPFSGEVIVENGGDIWLKLNRPCVIGIYVNNIYFKQKTGLKIYPEQTPCSICTSTSKLGHSLSFGKADSATVIADTGATADAAATAVLNMVQKEDDMENALEYGMTIPGVSGCLIVFRDKLAAIGGIELSPID